MRETLRDPLRLKHMHEAILRVNKFMDGKQIENLDEDQLLFFAVVKNIEIIGEAAYKLTLEFKESHPQTPWRDIIGMRHILVHGYYQINSKSLFKVYSESLPVLKKQLTDYLSEIGI